MSNVTIENLTKIYGNRLAIDRARSMLKDGKTKTEIVEETGATVGVDNVSLKINEGETFVIMGLSGSGKSTLLRMINRLIEPTHGSVKIDGEDLTSMTKEELRNVRRDKVSMVFQNFGLFPHKTILENAAYGLEIKGVDKQERLERATRALENAGLGSYIDQLPKQLSGGMQQRVGLARALANDPEVLLMDEAFSALDPLIRRDMQDELVELQANLGKTVIFITHDLDEALRIGDRIALMKDGEIVQVGTGEEILTNPADDYVERFVESVDRAKVLTAEHAMKRPHAINVEREGARVALRRMQELDTSNLFVVDNNKNFKGYITDSDAHDLIESETETLNIESIIKKDMAVVNQDTPVNEIYETMHNTFMPLAVVDDSKHLVGVISRKHVIELLAGEGEVAND